MRVAVAVRGALVAGYVAVVPTVLLVEDGRLWGWAAVIAALPLFWIVGGFHLWRRICPLSFFSQVPRLLGRPGDRKVTGWIAENALLVQLGVMFVALTARLLWLNGSQAGLAGFFVVVALLAFASGAVFRGKSWCNFFCPVGMVERVYTEPSRLLGTENSQCATCSACKKQCPDIDAERSYWKGTPDRDRRIAYFAWPGLVLGFYVHYWVQAGTWDWYFSGDWTREADIASKILSAGWFFGDMPRLAAAPLTLLVTGLASYGLFSGGHHLATRYAERKTGGDLDATATERIRHRAFALAGYVGFNLFYAYAGQPFLRSLPTWVRWAVAFAVVAGSTFIFVKRWGRSEAAFVQDRLARKLAKRWAWDDEAGDRSSTELVVLHAERTRLRKERLDSYRESVAELAAEGILTRDGLAVLGAVRSTLGITDAEHDKIVLGLTVGGHAFGESGASPEAALQREQYRQELERLVEVAAHSGAAIDAALLLRLQRRHGVSPEEHEAMLGALLDPRGALRGRLAELAERLVFLAEVEQAAASGDAAEAEQAFVSFVCTWAGSSTAEALRAALESLGEGADDAEGLSRPSARERGEAARALLTGSLSSEPPTPHEDPLTAALDDADPWVARAARVGTGPAAELQRLVALPSVALFAGLRPPDLERLDKVAEPRTYEADDALCVQGESGDEVLIILSGMTRILVSGVEVNTCGPGSCIGELAVLAPAPRTASVIASEPTVALVLSGELFRELLREQPLLVEGVLGQVARRLQQATSR